MPISKSELRQQLRTARSAIAPQDREQASKKLYEHVLSLAAYDTAQNIALYWPHDDEIDALPILNGALKQKKKCYLPVLLIDPHQKLAFASYTPETPLVKNRYGIPEPELSFASLIRLIDLDVIFVPLVGFDMHGRRLGRGGGFYDATFADFQKNKTSKWPKLIGLAYQCQLVAEVPADTWDWQLDAVVTEQNIFNFK